MWERASNRESAPSCVGAVALGYQLSAKTKAKLATDFRDGEG
jgi:hypothetical protein